MCLLSLLSNGYIQEVTQVYSTEDWGLPVLCLQVPTSTTSLCPMATADCGSPWTPA